MKKINSLLAIFTVLLLTFNSCVPHTDKDMDPKSDPVKPPAVATLSLKARDTAFINANAGAGGSVIVDIFTDGQVIKTGGRVVTSPVTITGIKNDTTIIFEVTNVNEAGSSLPKIDSVRLKTWSTTQGFLSWDGVRSQKAKLKMVNKVKDGVPYPVQNLDCNVYVFQTNKICKTTIGPCNPDPGTIWDSFYSLDNSEQDLNRGPGNTWHIWSISEGTLVIWKIIGGSLYYEYYETIP